MFRVMQYLPKIMLNNVVVTLVAFLCHILGYVLGFLKRLCFSVKRSVRSVRGKTKSRRGKQDGPLILTPLIEREKVNKARKLSEVDPSLFAGVNSHAAYITVDKIRKWNLFFWYFPAQGVDLESTPLVIWLQGGPGSSSLYGLFHEIGPLQIVDGSVQKMPITWGTDYSLLFIDNPVGTGFSFTEGEEYVTNQDAVGRCLLSFIQQFLHVFPELRKAPLFITGESYAGKYIPAFGYYIHQYKDCLNPINLRGLSIGNGWIDPPTMLHFSEWAVQGGLIDHKQAKDIRKLESEARRNWREHDLSAYNQNASKAMTMVSVVSPVNVYNYMNGEAHQPSDPFDSEIETFLNKAEVQIALHVKRQTFAIMNKTVFDWLFSDLLLTVKPWLEELMENYGVLCYNGQLDMMVPYALSARTYKSLQWSGRQGYLDDIRECLYDEENNSQINSFVKRGLFFMEAMVVGAGHMVPADKPRAAKQLIDKFIDRFK